MARLVWDKIEERRFEAGIDRGVIFPVGGGAAVWNGLVAVTETGSRESKSYNYEGLKVLERVIPGAYAAKIEAFTYPDILDELTGVDTWVSGIRVHDSLVRRFHLTYRTMIGNALDPEIGYKIHLVYNLVATPEDISSGTIGDNVEASTFGWSVKGMQKNISNGQPLDHISIDSTKVDPAQLQEIENQLYGTAGTNPSMPDPLDLVT